MDALLFMRTFYRSPGGERELIKLHQHQLNQCHQGQSPRDGRRRRLPGKHLLLPNFLKPVWLRFNNNQEFTMAKGNRSQKKEIKKKKKVQPKPAPPTRRGS